MNGWRVIVGVVLLGTLGCGEDAQFKNKCNQITSERCARDDECAGQIDYETCRLSFEGTWQCDPDATIAEMDLCIDQMSPVITPCGQDLMPQSCYEVLCSTLIPCDFETTRSSTQ